MSLEARVREIIIKANANGYDREIDDSACIYWYGNQQYFDHEFLKAYFGKDWWHRGCELLAIIGDQFAKLDFLEKFM